MLRELSEREAGAPPDLRVGVVGRGKDASNNLSELRPDELKMNLHDVGGQGT